MALIDVKINPTKINNNKGVSGKEMLIGSALSITATIAYFQIKGAFQKHMAKLKKDEDLLKKAEETKAKLEEIKARSDAKIREAHAKNDDQIKFRQAMQEMKEKEKEKEKEKQQHQDSSNDDNKSTPTYEKHAVSDYMTEEYDIVPLIGDLLPLNTDALLYGKKGSMKSYLTINTLAQLALKEKPTILSENEMSYNMPENMHSIYINGENDKKTMKARLQYFAGKLSNSFEVFEKNTLGEDLDAFCTCIRDACLACNDGDNVVIGIDNIKSLLNGLSKDETKKYLNCFRCLRSEMEKRRMTLSTITVCHTEKTGDQISGTYDLPCQVPYVFRIDEDKTKGKDIFVLTTEFARDGSGRGSQRLLKVSKDGYKHHVYMPAFEPMNAEKPNTADSALKQNKYSPETIDKIISLHSEGFSYRDIADNLKQSGIEISAPTIGNILKRNGQGKKKINK